MRFLIISKIDEKGKLIKIYNEIVGLDDLQVNYDLDEGNYLIWLYIPKRYFPGNDKLDAHFMVSSEHKLKIGFIDYDIDYKYIKVKVNDNLPHSLYSTNNVLIDNNII